MVRFPCGYCGINFFETKSESSYHKTMCRIRKADRVLETYPDGMYVTCTICLEKFETTGHAARAHMKEYHFELGEACPECKDLFFSKVLLRAHIKSVHTRILKCDQCDKSYGSHDKLRAHQEKNHTNCTVICGECGAIFKDMKGLNRHEAQMHKAPQAKQPKFGPSRRIGRPKTQAIFVPFVTFDEMFE